MCRGCEAEMGLRVCNEKKEMVEEKKRRKKRERERGRREKEIMGPRLNISGATQLEGWGGRQTSQP